eukprot:1144004-Pelagomonas_calceolata.AAC.1
MKSTSKITNKTRLPNAPTGSAMQAMAFLGVRRGEPGKLLTRGEAQSGHVADSPLELVGSFP